MDDAKRLPSEIDGATYVPEAVQTPVPASEAPTVVPLGGGAAPPRAPGQSLAPPPTLQPGAVLAGRYEIVQILGEGGMGAVYKARDTELDRLVALKVIRPELAGNPAILQRFKQELILARQVTHRNVIRIYDIGEDLGTKFITMEFVEGRDLHHLLKERGKFPPKEAAEVMKQVCLALEAAHGVNVIHRDLKPQNIMRDDQGRILVMDFGLARTAESSGMTQTGALVGTIEYMSPEQALGKELDARSDLFTVGLIFYELLTGKMPYKADSAIASLMKRNSERAVPASQIDPEVPRELSAVVSKCLEREPAERYQSASEIVADLDAWLTGGRTGSTVKMPAYGEAARALPWKWMLVGGLAAAIGVGIALTRQRTSFPRAEQAAPSGPVVSVAVLPFRNASSDTSMDWLGPSVADMLNTDIGESAQLRLVSQDRLQQILKDLKVTPGTALDAGTVKTIAEFSSADTVVSGQFARFGDRIRLDAVVQNVKAGRSTPLKAEAPTEKELLTAVSDLAQSIRGNLSLSSDALKQLQSQSFTLSKSVQAVRYYNEGLQAMRQGNNLEAQKRFEAATKEDPDFALAYSRLGQTYANLGYDDQAERASRRAVELSDGLPQREKYLVLANQARAANNNKKAIEYYENLAQAAPDDLDVRFTLGSLYEAAGTFDKAHENYAKVLERDPKYVDALLATGRVEIKRGNPQGSLDYLSKALSLAVQFDNQEEKASILQATGIAYKLLGKLEDALSNFQQSLDIKRKIGQKRGMAASLNQIAQVQGRLGKPDAAVAGYTEALNIYREIGDKRGAGDTLIDIGTLYVSQGKRNEALKLYKESLQIQRELGNTRNEALVLNNIGGVQVDRGEYEDALTNFQQALHLREQTQQPDEMMETLHNLAETLVKMGRYEEGRDDYLRVLELRRKGGDQHGAAIEAYGLGVVFEAQGRFGAALKSKQEAVGTLRQQRDRTAVAAEMISGLGRTLAETGSFDAADKEFNDAMAMARELHNRSRIAQVLSDQGDAAFFRQDLRTARSRYVEAFQSANGTDDRENALRARFNLARVDVKERHGSAKSLRQLVQEANTLGLKALSVECSLYAGEALIAAKDLTGARGELERALGRAEKLGLAPLQAYAEYLLARTTNGREASNHYRAAVRSWDEIGKDAGAVLQRPDIAAMYAEAKSKS